MHKFIVSFCVPVFNNADVAYKIATDLLKNPNPYFQVVISDNHSEDNTVSRLLTIHDKRLKLCTNNEGKGAKMNWYNALKNGDGKYLYLVMGRDKLYIQDIECLISKLLWSDERGIACIQDRPRKMKKNGVYKKDQAYRFLLNCDHPTGIIFRKKEWDKIWHKHRLFAVADTYPENFIKAALIREYPVAVLDCGVYSKELYIDPKKVLSTFEKGSSGHICYFFPQKRTQQHINIIRLIGMDKSLSDSQFSELFVFKVREAFACASRVYKAWMVEPCVHYGVSPRRVGRCEQYINILACFRAIDTFFQHYSWYKKSLKCSMLKEAIKAMAAVK